MILRDILRMPIPFFAGFDLMVFLSVIFKIFFMERFVHPNRKSSSGWQVLSQVLCEMF